MLAVIDVITIIITLLIAYNIYKTYDESFKVNESWMQRSIKYDQLTDLAIAANGPGNDIFESRDVEHESSKLKSITDEIDSLKAFLLNDAKSNLRKYPEVKDRLEEFSNNVSRATELSYMIFGKIEDNKVDEASSYMSQMDSKFHAALLDISKLRSKVREIQKEHLLLYHDKAQQIFYKEFYVAGFILLLVCFILYFCQRIKNSFDKMIEELE